MITENQWFLIATGRVFSRCFYFLIISSILLFSCLNNKGRNEQLARQYCGSCHVYPEPELLSKHIWKNSVMPEMAFRMGFPAAGIQSRLPRRDMDAVLAAVPHSPILSKKEFESIVNYYLIHSPDSLIVPEIKVESSEKFKLLEVPALQGELITALKYDSKKQELFIGVRSGKLYKLNEKRILIDSAQLATAISEIKILADEILVSEMGIMDPSEQAKGRIISLDLTLNVKSSVKDSLQRPVFFEKADLNGDNRKDFVVCNFGNYTGNTLLLEALSDGYEAHALNRMPGARKVVINDFNNDGLEDILLLMTQGDERIIIYYNEGDFKFREHTIIRFPPVYGSNSIEAVDFNKDGFLDILTTNGDNGDYSVVHKPYHAVRLFENDKENSFKEVWSFPMPGASQAKAFDFDNDGDTDIAAISFFANTAGSFLLFENMGDLKFVARKVNNDRPGRWLVMETGDYDNDSDIDIFLGSFNYNGLGARELNMRSFSRTEHPSLLILKNSTIP